MLKGVRHVPSSTNDDKRSFRENNFVTHILNYCNQKQNSQLTIMGYLLKRNQSKSLLGYGKNVRFFVLDFQFQKFYYKQKESSKDFRIVSSFSQICGIYKFMVESERTAGKAQEDASASQGRSSATRYGGMRTEKELEEERNLKWNHGLEVYFKDPADRDKTKMIVVYFNTPRTQALWAERFDRIIFSN